MFHDFNVTFISDSDYGEWDDTNTSLTSIFCNNYKGEFSYFFLSEPTTIILILNKIHSAAPDIPFAVK